MLLFDDIKRDCHKPSTELESAYSFLNRSARPVFGQVRDEIESWLANYPNAERAELVARLKDDFFSPWYELFLYQLLTIMGAKVTVHPKVGTRGKRPEFLVRLEKFHFILEATLFNEESNTERNRERSIGFVIDRINQLDVPFYLSIQRVSFPNGQQIAASRVVDFLVQELNRLDPDDLVENNSYHQLPKLRYSHGKTSIDFLVMPKSKEGRKKKTRVVGMQSKGFTWGTSELSLKKTLERKAMKYGDLNQPYIVAANTLGTIHLDKSELRGALFGRVQEYVPAGTTECCIRYLDDGLWGNEHNPKCTRVSAVLLGMALPWNVPRMELFLFRNPWAKHPLPESNWPFPVVDKVGDSFETISPTFEIKSLFDLDENWGLNPFEN